MTNKGRHLGEGREKSRDIIGGTRGIGRRGVCREDLEARTLERGEGH